MSRPSLAGIALPAPGSAPRGAEAFLRRSLVASWVAAAAVTGALAHLVVRSAPRHQVSFGFLVAWCAGLAGAFALIGYPAGLIGGEDEHQRGTVRTLRDEVAGATQTDHASGWRHWVSGVWWGLSAAVGAGLLLGVMKFALLGRPVGFWLLWGWSAVAGASALAFAGGYGRRRGVLLAGRRAHGMAMEPRVPDALLKRVWLTGALTVGLFAAASNAALAWVTYRWGVTPSTFRSDLSVAVVLTTAGNYVLGRQWGRADWRSGRLVVPAGLDLPPRVRIGPQGAVFAVVAVSVLLNLGAHLLPSPPSLAGVVALRLVGGLLAGGCGFALGAIAGVLNTEAAERESR